jgi:hypothetical protein
MAKQQNEKEQLNNHFRKLYAHDLLFLFSLDYNKGSSRNIPSGVSTNCLNKQIFVCHFPINKAKQISHIAVKIARHIPRFHLTHSLL